MIFTMTQENQRYVIKEDGRLVFSFDYVKENNLLSIYLKNMYGNEILGVYQIKKWYSKVCPTLLNGFTIYEHEEKLGEIHRKKGSFEIFYHDVFYRIYSGNHAAKRMAICFDRKQQLAEFVIGEESRVKFKNSNLGVLFSFMMILMKEFLPQEKFSQQVFFHHYKGIFKDEVDLTA